MILKRNKVFIYVLILLIILSLLTPICSFAFSEDSIYVWSNNSSVSTSILPSSEEVNSTDNSR